MGAAQEVQGTERPWPTAKAASCLTGAAPGLAPTGSRSAWSEWRAVRELPRPEGRGEPSQSGQRKELWL